jgi:hypothetical protein
MARSIFAAFLSAVGLGSPAVSAAAPPEATATGQQAAADRSMEYMGEIARAIIEADDIESDWDELSLVLGFDDDGTLNETYGYAYDASGDFEAISIRPRLLREPAEAYRQWLMRLRDGKVVEAAPIHDGIIKMLFQFNRRKNKVNADFEYDDTDRWKVTPNNLDAMIEELRPKL